MAPLLACATAAAEPRQSTNDVWRLAQAATPPPAGTPAGNAQPAPQAEANGALRRRIEQLEEQLVDMQVVIGTLESLATRGAPPAARSSAPLPSNAPDNGRIDGLETQVRALAAQIEQLTTQVRALAAAPRRAEAAEEPPQATSATELPAASPAERAMAAPSTDRAMAAPPTDRAVPEEAPDADRFGSTTVTAGKGDAIGGLIDKEGPKPEPAASDTVAAAPPAFMPPPVEPADAANPKQLYETAYGYLMQRDYGAAQSAFEDFLGRYPKDSLAGNAQYWLGEAHFVRGEYRAAAGAFLKGYQDYAGNARAADSLLRLAMSLDRLGQKDAACSSFAELSKRFPDAPENVKTSARQERKRIGCR